MTGWTEESLIARVSDPVARTRHAAGSPDPFEVATYEAGFSDTPHRDLAVVLGMTPELRKLAARHFDRVVCVDINQDAIDLYRDWLPPDAARRETVVRGDWRRLHDHVEGTADVVLGDGVFPNLESLAEHERLFSEVATVLRPGGRFVTRQVLVPRGLDIEAHSWCRLRDTFRSGHLDRAEFGLAVRLLGHLGCCYDPVMLRLDNAEVFAETAREHGAGSFTDDERASIERYHFDGPNTLLPETRWEALVKAAGYTSQKVELKGRDWYRYYPLYVLTPPLMS